MKLKLYFTSFFLLFSCLTLIAQQKYTISGYIRDEGSGEDLIFANIYNEANPAQGTTSNEFGFYSLTLPEGDYKLIGSYLGYNDFPIQLTLKADTILDITLSDESVVLDSTITVTAERTDENVQSTKMGTIELSMETAKKLPALLGEVDILKTIQLLPGVLASGEGTTGFYVRGGGVDQNLILLDDAIVYNSGHLLGFFSVFNSDAIKNVTLIKGGMPANYGGRLSSVLDIQMKEGSDKHFGIEGGIGLISSRLTLEGPIVKDKASFIISGRRTYLFDIAQPFIKNTEFAGTNYYFYDLNLKANYRISHKDRLFLSGYFGRDVLDLQNPDRNFNFNMPWGNATATLRWNHLFNDKLFMRTLFFFNDYDFTVSGGQESFSFKLESGVRDFGGKLDLTYYASPKVQVKSGYDYNYHIFTPNVAEAFSGDEPFIVDPEKKRAHEMGVYGLVDWKISPLLAINVGARFSMFQQVGPYSSNVDSSVYRTLEPVKTYFGVEPRFSGKYTVTENSSIKAGITLGQQYVHLVTNSTSTLPTDLWVPSTENVLPQWGLQYALGYFHNFFNNSLETSIEVYYKDLYNQLDYSESYTQTVDTDVEQEFISGRGHAYGVELFVRRTKGKFTGWIAYTLARSIRIFDEIKGRKYLSGFDRTHDLSIVASYDFSDRFNVGASFVLGSGAPFTPVKSIYLMGFNPTLEYGLRNSARLPIYHRLDLSASYKLSKPNKRFESTLVFSIYNVYNRRNVFFTYVNPETDALSGSVELKSYRVSLFPIIPSIAWNFKWKSKPLKKKR
ncbi:MAG: TonB-dependent receptor [Saprospiraceae bacterium]|nr:TonB-dependent receptor [Saprospiraceae bacterium]